VCTKLIFKCTGELLRPDEQLILVDGALRLSFEPMREINVWAAFSTIGPHRFGYVLSTYLPPEGVRLGAAEVGFAVPSLVAWDRQSSLDGLLWSRGRLVDELHPLELRGCPGGANPREKAWVYTIVAPRLSAACALVFAGELDKTVAASSVRFDEISCASTGDAITVRGRGFDAEVVTLGFARASPPFSILTETAVVRNGRFSATLRADREERGRPAM